MSIKDVRQLVNNSMRLTLISAVQKAISLLGGVLIGKYLGASDYGVFSIVRTIVETMTSVVRGGFDLVTTKNIANFGLSKVEKLHIIRRGMSQLIVGAIIVCILVLAILPFKSSMNGLNTPHLLFVVIFASISVPFMMMGQFSTAVGAGLLKPVTPALIDGVIQPLCRLIIFFTLLSLIAPIIAISIATTLSFFIGGIGGYMWLSRKEIEPIFRLLGLEDFSLGSLYDKQAIALSINFLISNLLQRVDLIISGFFFSSIFVGSYSMALVVFSTLSVFIAPQNRILAPTLSAHWKLGELGPMAKLLNEQIRHISCIIVPASIAISLSIPLLYKLLSGDYQIQWQVLLLLSLNFSIQGCLNFTGFALSMTGGEGIERRVLLFGVVFVCVLGACGAYLFGPVGMAFGILMGNIAGAVWRTLEASKRVESNLGWEFPFKLNIILSPIGCIGAYLVFFGKPNINLLLLIPVLYLVTSYTFIWYFVLSADERVSVSRRIPF